MSLKFNTIAITTCLMLTACGGNDHSSSEVPQPQPQPQPQPYDILDKSNYVTAYKFQERYNLTNINCGDDSLQAIIVLASSLEALEAQHNPNRGNIEIKIKQKVYYLLLILIKI